MYRWGQKSQIHQLICLKNKISFKLQSLLKATSINFKGYKIDLSFWEIAVPRLMGNTEGFAQLFSIKYRLKHNLKTRKHHRSVMLKVLHCGMLRTWRCFSPPINFSPLFSPFPLCPGLDWDILAFIAAFQLLLLGSFPLQCKASCSFSLLGRVQRGREGEKNTGNRKLCAPSFSSAMSNSNLFLF